VADEAARQGASGEKGDPAKGAASTSTATEATRAADPTDDLVERKHSLTIGRKKLAYTTSTGRIVLREEVIEDGKFAGFKPRATVFISAYTLDGVPSRERPVTFAFNGGPGSSSVWLHLGLLGPRRVRSGDVDDHVPPPYDVVDNLETLLVHTDLVFIDPVATGFSRAVDGVKPADPAAITRLFDDVRYGEALPAPEDVRRLREEWEGLAGPRG